MQKEYTRAAICRSVTVLAMNDASDKAHDEIPHLDPASDSYTPLLLAFGPADHEFEAEGSEEAGSYIVGYN